MLPMRRVGADTGRDGCEPRGEYRGRAPERRPVRLGRPHQAADHCHVVQIFLISMSTAPTYAKWVPAEELDPPIADFNEAMIRVLCLPN